MNHTPAQVVRMLLLNYVLGTEPEDELDWPIFFDHMPDGPDEAICVYHTQGRMQGRIHITGENIEQYGIQIKVRAATRSVARRRMELIMEAMDLQVLRDYVELDDDGYTVQSMNRTSSLLPDGYDTPSSQRRSFTTNYTASITPTATLPGSGSGTGT